MAEKNLPIKFFQKRQNDDFSTEGSGGRKLPRWAIPELVGEKAAYIRNVLSRLSGTFTNKIKQNNYVPSVIRVKLNEEALTKTPRKEIGNLFNIDKRNVIGMHGIDELLVKIDSEKDLQTILKELQNINIAYSSFGAIIGISAITDVGEYKPQVTVETDDG